MRKSTMPTHSYRLSHLVTESHRIQENHPFEVLPIAEGTVGTFEYNEAITDDRAIDLSDMY